MEAKARQAPDHLLRTLLRRRWLILATFLLGTGTAAVVSKTLDPVYSTSSKLLVIQSSDRQSFDAVQAGQVTARTYADILDSSNIAQAVADELGQATTGEDVAEATTFEPIPETQLLSITAEDARAREAQRIANTYAEVFTAYARDRLRATTQANVSIADRAPLPPAPARPKPTLYTLLAAVLSLILGVALALVRDRFDTRISSVEDVERDFDLTPLARIPRRGRTPQSKAQFAEAFRMLRVSLTVSSTGDAPPSSVVFTSTSEGEGKTTATRQLAFAAAEARRRVVVVEADIYRPQLAAALGLSTRTERGLTTYLTGDAELQEVIVPTAVPNLWLLPAGPPTTSLTALLEGQRGRQLLPTLTKAVDLVIFDCPPLAPRSDAALLAATADATILVLDLEITTRPRLTQAIRMLASVEAEVAGCVINRDATGGGASYSYAVEELASEGDGTPRREPVEA